MPHSATVWIVKSDAVLNLFMSCFVVGVVIHFVRCNVECLFVQGWMVWRASFKGVAFVISLCILVNEKDLVNYVDFNMSCASSHMFLKITHIVEVITRLPNIIFTCRWNYHQGKLIICPLLFHLISCWWCLLDMNEHYPSPCLTNWQIVCYFVFLVRLHTFICIWC